MAKIEVSFEVVHDPAAAVAVAKVLKGQVIKAASADTTYSPHHEMDFTVEVETTETGSCLKVAFFNRGGDHNMSTELAAHRLRWHFYRRHAKIVGALRIHGATMERYRGDTLKFQEAEIEGPPHFVLCVVLSDRLLGDFGVSFPIPEAGLPPFCTCGGCGESFEDKAANLELEMELAVDDVVRLTVLLTKEFMVKEEYSLEKKIKKALRKAASCSTERTLAALQQAVEATPKLARMWVFNAIEITSSGPRASRLPINPLAEMALTLLSTNDSTIFGFLNYIRWNDVTLPATEKTHRDFERWLFNPDREFGDSDYNVVKTVGHLTSQYGPMIERFSKTSAHAKEAAETFREKTWYGEWCGRPR